MALQVLNRNADHGQHVFFAQTVTDTTWDQNDVQLIVPNLGVNWRIVDLGFQVPTSTVTGADVDIDIRVNNGSASVDVVDGYAIDENDATRAPVSLMGSIDVNGEDTLVVEDDEYLEVVAAGAVATLAEPIVFWVIGVFEPSY